MKLDLPFRRRRGLKDRCGAYRVGHDFPAARHDEQDYLDRERASGRKRTDNKMLGLAGPAVGKYHEAGEQQTKFIPKRVGVEIG